MDIFFERSPRFFKRKSGHPGTDYVVKNDLFVKIEIHFTDMLKITTEQIA